jgi:hypothetical protein
MSSAAKVVEGQSVVPCFRLILIWKRKTGAREGDYGIGTKDFIEV